MSTVADVIIEVLTQAGAERCYGVPGDTLNHVTDAIRRSDMRFVHVRHEEAGGFAAGAEALLTQKLAVCAGSCGPGSLHFINGLFDAHRSRAPVVLLASQVVRDELGFDFPQEVDFKSVYASASVFCEELRTPENARRLTAAAAQAALTRRGVAVLILPSDVTSASAPKQPGFRVHHPQPRMMPSERELQDMADLLNASERVTIYGGSGCHDSHDAVVALAQHLQAPVAYTSRAKDFLEYDNPHAVGMTGIFGIASGYKAIQEADTLLLLGCDFAWRQFYPDKAKIIQVDIDGTHLGRRHPVDLGVVGDTTSTITQLLPLLRKKDDSRFLERALDHRKHAIEELDERVKPSTPIRPQWLTETIDKYANDDAIWTADGGSPMVWSLRHVKATGRNRTVISLTHGTMANAMPNALGACAAYPGRQVISLSGDGGLGMLLGDLMTTVQEKLPIKVVVFNNGSLNFVELEQKVEGLLNTYTDLHNPDFSAVARAIGLWGERVESPDLLENAVQRWLAEPGPALLDVVVDRFELVIPPKVEMAQVFGTALYSVKAILEGRGKDVVELVERNVKD